MAAVQGTIRENLMKHKQTILRSLYPQHFFLLFPDLDDMLTNHSIPRHKKAERLLGEVERQNVHSAFLTRLEQDRKHLGHKYIVSLLMGKQFAPKEEIEDSEKLQQEVDCNMDVLVQQLNVSTLIPSLIENHLITDDDQERLRNPYKTTQDRVRELFMILKTKGPTAHRTFVRKCLRTENEHIPHSQLYSMLTNSEKARCSPHLLESPKGIKCRSYRVWMREVRQLHQIGGEEWREAERICNLVTEPGSNFPPEMKIAFHLENCNILILSGQSDKVFPIVDQAREMCHKLVHCDTQALEARCEWVLAKLYRCRKQPEKALEHISTAFSLNDFCKAGEERILTHYCRGCIFLDSPARSPRDQRNAISCFQRAISSASDGDFGLKIHTHGKIRLVQAYIGSSSNRPGKSKDESSQDDVMMAEQLLTELDKDESLNQRTRCMLLYTWFDLYRAKGHTEQARECIGKASDIAKQQNLQHEMKSIEIRLDFLNKDHQVQSPHEHQHL